LLSSTFSCAIFRGFKISPWDMYRYRRFVVLKLSYKYSG
jgi:hypothetical protein